MSDSVLELDKFKQMLSQTFEQAEPNITNSIPTSEFIAMDDGYDYEDEQEDTVSDNTQGMQFDDSFDDLDSDDDKGVDTTANSYGYQQSNNQEVSAVKEQPAVSNAVSDYVGVKSVNIVEKHCSLKDEIKNTIYNLGFSLETCIEEFNAMFGTNLSSMEELYSSIIYNNYFKRVKVSDIDSISTSDLIAKEVETKSEVLEHSDTSILEKELASMEYPDFIKLAIENNRIPTAIFEKYNDLFKALYVADYLEAFGEEIDLDEDSDVVYTILVGRYITGMSELDYRKIMYLLYRTDMAELLAEKESVDSYSDITFYKISKLVGTELIPEEKSKFYISQNGKINSYSIDLVWHNAEAFVAATNGLTADIVEGKLLFYDAQYTGNAIVDTINSESSLTVFVSNHSDEKEYFYYNYNKLLDMISNANMDVSEEVCAHFSEMSDLDIAKHDFVFGNIVKYNKELIGCITSKRFKLLINCMFYIPGREPIAFASYRLISLICSTLWRSKFELVTKKMTQELSRDCSSVELIGIPGINMIGFADFWVQFDALATYLASANKISLSVFNSIIRLKIE